MRNVYAAYGLRIGSTLPLSGFASSTGDHSGTDVEILPELVPPPENEPEGQGCWRADAGEAVYHWSGVGSLLIQNGKCIRYDEEAGADSTALRLTIAGPGLATILHQRGLLVLHASAVLTESGVVAFVGPSGRGKSTAASLLLERGYELFTDDVLALQVGEGIPLAWPGPSHVKLWPQSALALGQEPDTLPRLGEGYIKRVRNVTRRAQPRPAPLCRVYLLQEGPHPESVQVAAGDALMQLMTQSYCSEVLRFCGDRQNFLQCAELVRKVPVRALIRGGMLDQLPVLADIILQDLEDGASCQVHPSSSIAHLSRGSACRRDTVTATFPGT